MSTRDENLKLAEDAITYTKSIVQAASNVREDRLKSQGGIDAVIAKNTQGAHPPTAPATTPQTFSQKLQFFQSGGPQTGTASPSGTKPQISKLVWDLYKLRCNLAQRKVYYEQQLGRQFTPLETITYSATEIAQKYGIGNCGEQAAIAFLYLRDRGARPIDYMFFTTQGYDHSFVIIGRAQFSTLTNVRTWGKDAVWCDPWQCRTGRAYAIDDFVAGRVRNLDAIYKLNTPELVGAGVPEPFCRIE